MLVFAQNDVIVFGIQASPGQTYVDEYWYPMLQAATNNIGKSAEVYAIATDVIAYEMVANGSLDYFYMGSALFNCLQTQYDVAPLVSSIQNVKNEPTSYIGAAIIAREDSGYENIDDLRGSRIALPQLAYLSSCQAQWFEMVANGLNLFRDTAVVVIAGTEQEVILAVDTGVVDIGFLTAGDLDKYTSPEFVPDSDFIYVNEMNLSFPAPVSTRLYPGSLLGALSHTTLEERAALAESLMDLDSQSLNANISQWIVFQNYDPVRNIQSQLQVLESPALGESHGSCLTSASDLTDYVRCPPGFTKKNDEVCLLNGRPCPLAYQCLCDPCIKNELPYKAILSTIIPLSFILVILIYVTKQRCQKKRFENLIQYEKLGIDPTRKIGESSRGLVLKGNYLGVQVAVKRVYTVNVYSKISSPFDSACTESDTNVLNQRDGFLKMMKCYEGMYDLKGRFHSESLRVYQLSRVQHANIMPITGMSYGPSRKDLLIVSPLMKYGTIYDFIRNRTLNVDDTVIAPIIRDVCEGLTYLHSIGKFGADIRSHHLLLDDGYHVRFTRTEKLPPNRQTQSYKVCCAPELVRGDAFDNSSSDVYSIGMLMYELFYRKPPYQGEQASDIIASWRPPKLDLSRDENELEQIMQACWSNKVSDRPNISTLLRIIKNHTPNDLADALFVEPSRSKLLLKSALPISVAVALKEGKRVESQTKFVTLCLLSIHDMSIKDQRMSNRIYSIWDEIYQSLGLYRLATVDDSYLVAGNLHVNQEDHALRIARFAIKAIDALISTSLGLNLETTTTSQKKANNAMWARGAIHSCEVTAGIWGYHRPQYVVLGTGMTILCRISSSAEQGHIQMTKAACHLIEPHLKDLNAFIQERDGYVSVRGQGHLKTCWLMTVEEESRK